MVRKRSWPAVSHYQELARARCGRKGGGGLTIWSFTVLPSSSMVRIFCSGCQHMCGPAAGKGGGGTHKVDADCGDVRLGVRVVGETEQQARLADTGVADEEELEEVVVPAHVSTSAPGP
jgi:hypothetical protein